MPTLKDVAEFTESVEFYRLAAAPRPERVDCRTLEGTIAKLNYMAEKGFGATRSEAAHLCMQIGLIAFEEYFQQAGFFDADME